MATTVSAIQTKVNNAIQDSSTNSISAAQRLEAISVACQDTITAMGLPMQDVSYAVSFYDGVSRYNVTSSIPGYMDSVDLVRDEGDRLVTFSRVTPREIYVDIDTGYGQTDTFAVERLDGKTYLIINAEAKYPAVLLHDCDSLTSNGTWAADTSTSDASNISADDFVFKQGSGSIKFDTTVAQSVNNRATIYNSTLDAVDLSRYVGFSSLLFWVWIPEDTNFSSVTAYWGSSSSDYYAGSATTDINGNAIVEGQWNLLKVDWATASTTGSPDSSAIDYLRFDFNYTGSYTNQSGFRLDHVRMVRPETLTIKYQSNYIGQSSGGTKLFAFTATSDIPFYSGQYDYLDNVVWRRAAALLLESVGRVDESARRNMEWQNSMADVRKRFPSTRLTERNSFKTGGMSTSRRRIGRSF